MFKMLVFLLALEPLMLVGWLSLVYISSGRFSEGLPFAAIVLMSCSYFVKGFVETVEFVRGKIK